MMTWERWWQYQCKDDGMGAPVALACVIVKMKGFTNFWP
jgi:hypothetical protein